MTSSSLLSFKQGLALIFSDQLKGSWVNRVILGLIILSTLSIFLSTYDSIASRYGFWLNLIDYVTLAIFTVEVSLRIWVADLVNPLYAGWRGRLRYCFSFYGFTDIISTYSFYLALVFPISATAAQILRVFRLCRIVRYLKSIDILHRAFSAKLDEMRVSLEFLVIVTLILAFILYFVEHQAQPEVYNNGMTSVLWAFLQYIGDPGGLADTPPITVAGRIIASLIGILTLAIFAVPAGLLASSFSEIMQEDKEAAATAEVQRKLLQSFRFNYDRQHTKLYYVPRYQPVSTLLTRKFLSEQEVIKAVGASENFHLYNLANAVNPAEHPADKIVVVNYVKNRPYGCCINRGSKVTIVSTSGYAEPLTSWFAYHVAKLGGFNYIAKEVETNVDNPVSYYTVTDVQACENFSLFLADLEQLTAQASGANAPAGSHSAHAVSHADAEKPASAWVFALLGSAAPPGRESQVHFVHSAVKGDESFGKSTIKDGETYAQLFAQVQKEFAQYGHVVDGNKYFNITSSNFIHLLEQAHAQAVTAAETAETKAAAETVQAGTLNSCTIRINSKLIAFDPQALAYAQTLANCISANIEPGRPAPALQDMLKKRSDAFGFQGYAE